MRRFVTVVVPAQIQAGAGTEFEEAQRQPGLARDFEKAREQGG
jgi:hypothetical protein